MCASFSFYHCIDLHLPFIWTSLFGLSLFLIFKLHPVLSPRQVLMRFHSFGWISFRGEGSTYITSGGLFVVDSDIRSPPDIANIHRSDPAKRPRRALGYS